MTSDNQGLAWLKQQSRPARVWQLKIFTLRLAQLALQIVAFWHFALMVQRVVVAEQALVFSDIKVFLLLAMAWALCAWLADVLAYLAKATLENAIEAQIHQRLKTQHIALTRQHSANFWQQLLLLNLSNIGEYLTQYSVQKWLAAVAPLAVVLIILPLNYVVALTLLLTMPVVPLFMILLGKGAASIHRKHFVALERLGDMFSDRLKGLALITASGQHEAQACRLNDASHIVNRKTMQVVALAFLSSTALDFFASLSIALIAVFIGFVMLGDIHVGPSINLHHGLFMLLVTPLLFSELRLLGRYYHQKARAEAGADQLAKVLQTKKLEANHSRFSDLAWLNFSVAVPRLRAEKLAINSGDWIHLSGASGCGKTALLEALMGFRDSSHRLAGDLALMSQHSRILDNTLAHNLHLGRGVYTEPSLLQALDDVGLRTWLLSLPQGLATPMGDYPPLSGGEAQRLALARILLLNKQVVLLDEPTAHLSQSQHQQLSALIRDKLKNKTVIWASHKALPEYWFNQYWFIAEGKIQVSK